jgi:uncharacterized Ntn-hydrolase superfamily protein
VTFSIARALPAHGRLRHRGQFIQPCGGRSLPAPAPRRRRGRVAEHHRPRLGPRLLDLLAAGHTAQTAMAAVVTGDPTAEYRQLAVVDRHGGVAVHCGRHTLGIHHAALGDGAVAAGNLLAAHAVIDSLLNAYSRSEQDDLAARLLDGLCAALAAGGETGPVHSAGLAVTHPSAGWADTDLRVDWHDDPIGELHRLWQRWRPLREDYVTRGLHPASAPAYGVPGHQ